MSSRHVISTTLAAAAMGTLSHGVGPGGLFFAVAAVTTP